VAANEAIERRLGSMTPIARQLATKRSFWLTAVVFSALFCFANYHFSLTNQIPSDGPLTIGFPLRAYWMVCPMIASHSAACQSGISVLGLIGDALFCVALACVAAGVALRISQLDCVRRRRFWTITSLVFVSAFLLISFLTAWHSASLHGRGIRMGFPAVYLYEYAGDSFSTLNFLVDLVLCFAVSLLGVALLSAKQRSPR
jgi:hypothetical protein